MGKKNKTTLAAAAAATAARQKRTESVIVEGGRTAAAAAAVCTKRATSPRSARSTFSLRVPADRRSVVFTRARAYLRVCSCRVIPYDNSNSNNNNIVSYHDNNTYIKIVLFTACVPCANVGCECVCFSSARMTTKSVVNFRRNFLPAQDIILKYSIFNRLATMPVR
ncbi:unnamed protein product [Aphis gossypii]|uniref:Uncharacterized protein n=1 Tax=Aphis gossypii TaxID=80765 RepID=A0A9P0J471_APHGO|nr:unnamed protein product [Aphis gossypii]